MEITTSLLAAIIGVAVLITLVIYVIALRSQFRQAQAERERAMASETALREQQSWSRLVFDSTSDLMALLRVEPDGRLVFEYINRSLVEFQARSQPGTTARDWLGRDLADLIRMETGLDAAQTEALLAPYREAVRSGRGTPVSQTSGDGPNASYREGLITPLKDAAGRVTHLFYRGADVTERRRSAGELRRSADRFAKLFETIPIPIVISRLSDGRILEVNEAFVRGNVYSRERLLQSTSTELGMWVDPDGRIALRDEIASGARIRNRRMQFRLGNGELRDYLFSAERIDWHGEQAFVSFPMDVTKLEAARREAQASSERFEKLFDLSPVPIVIGALADGRYLAANEAWLHLHGYRREELAGHGSLSLGVWANPEVRAQMVQMLESGVPVRRLPVNFRKKSGEIFETLYSADFIDWQGEKAIVATPQDVTELKSAADEIRRLNETLEEKVTQRTAALEQANQELEAFSYSVSHDLRAPLRSLSSFSTLLAARASVQADAEATGYARRIRAAATRMGTIVDELLSYSRLARQEIVMRPVDLDVEVSSLVAEFGQSAAGRQLRWVLSPLGTVRGDPTLLRLVLQNLLDNAVKYTARQSEAVIKIEATRNAEGAVICVTDNGVGFDMQHAGNLFGVFQRLHADHEFEGTGIGLANAQRIVKRHGGRIWCTAAPDQGARFCFSLPA